ncbi:MAG: hypothetical protein ACOC1K_06830 [Nanoarchaeota archaeon]
MEKELIQFIDEKNLSPFKKSKVRKKKNKIFKTREAKKIHTRINNLISSNFQFRETKNLLKFFRFTTNKKTVEKRQNFFKKIKKEYNNSFLGELKEPKQEWSPKYSVIVVTSDEDTYNELKELNCPVKLLLGEQDLHELENYEVIQAIDCEDFSRVLEQLPSVVFLNSIDEVYLERYLEELSGWRHNISVLENNDTNNEINNIVSELKPLLSLLNKETDTVSREDIENELNSINEEIQEEIKDMNFEGNSLYNILSKGEIPREIEKIIEEKLENSTVPEEVVDITLPLKINEEYLDKYMSRKDSEIFSDFSQDVKENADKLRNVDNKLKKLSKLLLLFDFIAGISKFIEGNFPKISDKLSIKNSKNIFLENPSPISFSLIENKCSILTGANSGGKTTLLEHILQSFILLQLGLPLIGEVKLPLFNKIYYFSKENGTISKGAFESLLSQLSNIDPDENKTLILADEIEAVTEPGVAGDIITSTAEYFIKKNCYLVIATHLGQEIKDQLPEKARIDGIEASGLDENNNLIVNHNPVPNKLASSTPELIIEKLSKEEDNHYFKYLNSNIKEDNRKS